MTMTHTRNGKKVRVLVSSRTSISDGTCGMPSIYEGDVYICENFDIRVIGHLKASEFSNSFQPLPDMLTHHEECLQRCREFNGE